MKKVKRTLCPNGKRIKKALLDKGLSNKEFAAMIGTSPVHLCKILYGVCSGVTFLPAISQALDIDINKLKKNGAA